MLWDFATNPLAPHWLGGTWRNIPETFLKFFVSKYYSAIHDHHLAVNEVPRPKLDGMSILEPATFSDLLHDPELAALLESGKLPNLSILSSSFSRGYAVWSSLVELSRPS